MASSNSLGLPEPRNDGVQPIPYEPDWTPDTLEEYECKRCRGLGEDRDGADCVFCDGYGSIIST